MRTLVVLAALLPAAALAGGPEILPYGDCPGPMQILVPGLTPSGQWAMISGNGPGSTTIPSGNCAGFTVPVSGNVKVRHIDTADINGTGALNFTPPAQVCDVTLVALDLTTCAVSPPGGLVPFDGECFTGVAVGGTGAGTCADPIRVDISGLPIGDAGTYTLTGGEGEDMPDNYGGGATCTAPPVGTARDVVFQVTYPAGGDLLDVSVEGGGNPRIAILEDPSCFQPANFCVDDAGAGACEFLQADSSRNWHGNPTYVVISELVDSGTNWTVSFSTK